MLLSKSDFKVARTCGTKLYYRKLKYPTTLDDDPYLEFLADGGYMVEAIADKVARDEKRRAFIDDAAKSLSDFKRTGLAYTHEQVWDYLSMKAAAKKAPKPKPVHIPRSKR